MKRHLISTLLIVALGACAAKTEGSSSAARGGDRMPRVAQIIVPGGILLLRFDTDNDYKISTVEIEEGLTVSFDLADKDESGTLSLFEYRDWAALALGSPTALPDWMSVDRNQDRTISRMEFDGAFMRIAHRHGLTEDAPLELSMLVRDFEAAQQRTARSQTTESGSGSGKGGGGGRRRLEG